MQKRFSVLFVGAFPPPQRNVFGGMVTDCRALLQSTLVQRVDLTLLDTTQISNPPPSFIVRAFLAASRFARFVWRFERTRPDAVLLFAAVGASLLEKGVMARYAHWRGAAALLFPRSGSVIDDVQRSRFTRAWVKLALRGADKILAQGLIGQQFVMDLLHVPASRAPIVSNWVATPELLSIGGSRTAGPDDMVRLLFVGWLDREKGVLDLLQACKELTANKHFRLDLAGQGNASEQARSYIETHGLQERVRLLGWLQPQDVQRALASADVFVLPSWTEGLPNAMVEAMAARLAVVVSAVGNIPDVITQEVEGLLVQPRDVPGLAAALARVIDDRALRQSLADAAYRKAERSFSVEQAAAALEAAIRDACAARHKLSDEDAVAVVKRGGE